MNTDAVHNYPIIPELPPRRIPDEEALLKTARFLHRETGMEYLCMAGGA